MLLRFVKNKFLVIAMVAMAALGVAGATPPADFEGITEAQIQSVYTGVLNLIGTWVGILVGVLAVIVGTMWVVNRLRGGSGVK
jgi:quinol-cytochrome oxidoreductase complex cytochrome b subunit